MGLKIIKHLTVENGEIIMRGSDFGKTKERVINYKGSLRDIYDEIQRGTIHIVDAANGYKWAFILRVLTNMAKEEAWNYEKLKDQFEYMGQNLRDNGKKYQIEVYVRERENSTLVKPYYVMKNNGSSFTKALSPKVAAKYNLFEATVRSIQLKRNVTVHNVELRCVE